MSHCKGKYKLLYPPSLMLNSQHGMLWSPKCIEIYLPTLSPPHTPPPPVLQQAPARGPEFNSDTIFLETVSDLLGWAAEVSPGCGRVSDQPAVTDARLSVFIIDHSTTCIRNNSSCLSCLSHMHTLLPASRQASGVQPTLRVGWDEDRQCL